MSYWNGLEKMMSESRKLERELRKISQEERVVLTIYEGEDGWGKTVLLNKGELMPRVEEVLGEGKEFAVSSLDERGVEKKHLPRMGRF